MALKIATESEAVAIGGKTPSGYSANKLLTQGRVSLCGCKTSITSTNNNQCVPKDFLSKATTSLGTAKCSGHCTCSSNGTSWNISLTGYTAKSGVVVTIRATYAQLIDPSKVVNKSCSSISLSSSSVNKSYSDKFVNMYTGNYELSSVVLTSITDGYELNLSVV